MVKCSRLLAVLVIVLTILLVLSSFVFAGKESTEATEAEIQESEQANELIDSIFENIAEGPAQTSSQGFWSARCIRSDNLDLREQCGSWIPVDFEQAQSGSFIQATELFNLTGLYTTYFPDLDPDQEIVRLVFNMHPAPYKTQSYAGDGTEIFFYRGSHGIPLTDAYSDIATSEDDAKTIFFEDMNICEAECRDYAARGFNSLEECYSALNEQYFGSYAEEYDNNYYCTQWNLLRTNNCSRIADYSQELCEGRDLAGKNAVYRVEIDPEHTASDLGAAGFGGCNYSDDSDYFFGRDWLGSAQYIKSDYFKGNMNVIGSDTGYCCGNDEEDIGALMKDTLTTKFPNQFLCHKREVGEEGAKHIENVWLDAQASGNPFMMQLFDKDGMKFSALSNSNNWYICGGKLFFSDLSNNHYQPYNSNANTGALLNEYAYVPVPETPLQSGTSAYEPGEGVNPDAETPGGTDAAEGAGSATYLDDIDAFQDNLGDPTGTGFSRSKCDLDGDGYDIDPALINPNDPGDYADCLREGGPKGTEFDCKEDRYTPPTEEQKTETECVTEKDNCLEKAKQRCIDDFGHTDPSNELSSCIERITGTGEGNLNCYVDYSLCIASAGGSLSIALQNFDGFYYHPHALDICEAAPNTELYNRNCDDSACTPDPSKQPGYGGDENLPDPEDLVNTFICNSDEEKAKFTECCGYSFTGCLNDLEENTVRVGSMLHTLRDFKKHSIKPLTGSVESKGCEDNSNCVLVYGIKSISQIDIDNNKTYRLPLFSVNHDSLFSNFSGYETLEMYVWFSTNFEVELWAGVMKPIVRRSYEQAVAEGDPSRMSAELSLFDSYNYMKKMDLVDYVVNKPELNKWNHVVIPVSAFGNLFQNNKIDVMIFATDPKEVTNSNVMINYGNDGPFSNVIAIDKIFLRPKRADLASAGITGGKNNNLYCSGTPHPVWFTDLDDETNFAGEQIPPEIVDAKKGEMTCNSIPSYSWTGNECCGDDANSTLVENYADSEGGCLLSNPILNNEVAMLVKYSVAGVEKEILCKNPDFCNAPVRGGPSIIVENPNPETYSLFLSEGNSLKDIGAFGITDIRNTNLRVETPLQLLYYDQQFYGCNADEDYYAEYTFSGADISGQSEGGALIDTANFLRSDEDVCPVISNYFCDHGSGWSAESVINASGNALGPENRNTTKKAFNLVKNGGFENQI